MTNSKLDMVLDTGRGLFWFYVLRQIFTGFITWRIAKAYKERSIQVKSFCHFRGRFTFIIEVTQKLYLKEKTGRTSGFLKTGYLTTLKMVVLIHKTESNVCSCRLNYLALHSQWCQCFGASPKDWNESSFPVFIQSLIYQPSLVVNTTTINYFCSIQNVF